MADTQTYLGGDLSALGTHIARNVETTSPFFSAAQRARTDRDGKISSISFDTAKSAELVPEGGKKPRLEIVANTVALPWTKVAFVTSFSEETLRNDPGFEDELAKAATAELVKAINGYILGSKTAPSGVSFMSFDNVVTPKVEVDANDALAGFTAARKALTMKSGAVASDIILSGDLYGAIAYAPNAQGVAPYDGAETWNGVKPHLIRSLATGGVLGDFANGAVYDIAPDGVQIKLSTDAALTNEDGTVTSMFEENKVALVAEMYFRWGITDQTAFVKLTDAA